jgi:hypothetical protein
MDGATGVLQLPLQAPLSRSLPYSRNQLRYDLPKLKGHGLLHREGSSYAYPLTINGVQVALLFSFFHKRLCGTAATRFAAARQHPVNSHA